MDEIKTIIWDWNGTLLNDVELCRQSINTLLAKRSLPTLSLERYRQVFQFPIIAYYRKAGFDFTKEPFEVLAQEYMAYYQPRSISCALQPQALATLSYCRQAGKRQVLLSASKLDLLKEQLAHYPLAPYFDQVLGIQDVYAHSKAELAVRFVRENKSDPKEIVFIGDSVHDYEVAAMAGCRCILIADGHEHKEKLLRCRCEILDHIDEVPSLL